MNKSESPTKKISLGRKVIFFTVIFLVFFFILEGGLRTYYLILNKTVARAENYSEKYGWTVESNVKSVANYPGYGDVNFSTTLFGFRKFGNLKTSKQKIFVIGDSQTLSKKVTDGGTYFDYLGDNSNVEIFAFGVGGYGTFQQYMILDEYYDTIQPDIILWQFCENDFHNNSFDLESSDWLYSNQMIRPYYNYQENKTEYKFPHKSWLYRNILRHFYFFKLLNQKMQILFADNLGLTESQQPLGERKEFKEAVITTTEILKLAKKRVGNVPIVAFSACGISEEIVQNQAFFEICDSLDIYYISGIPDSIYIAAVNGESVNGLPYDAHWNDNGNAMAGKIILKYLTKNNLLDQE